MPYRLTVTVHLRRRLLWRVRVGVWFISLGCRIAGLGYSIREEYDLDDAG